MRAFSLNQNAPTYLPTERSKPKSLSEELYHHKKPLIDLSLYQDRNFRICSILMLLFCGLLFSFITLVPIMLQRLYGYTAMNAGWSMAPLGVASGVGMVLASSLMQKINVKWILTMATMCCMAGAWRYAHISPFANFHYFVDSNLFLGFGLGCFMVPLSTYALATIKKESIVEASGLFSYARMLGTSIGISLLSTVVSRSAQKSWNTLAGHINPFNAQYRHWLTLQHLPRLNHTGLARIDNLMTLQSGILAFIHTYTIITFCFLPMLPLIWRLKNVKLNANTPSAH